MKKTVIFLAAAALLLAFGSCSKYETEKNDPMKAKIYTLDNGLKVYMSVNKETPRIQTYIAVNVGGKKDPFETTGLAHYFEHLMFKGTEQFGTCDYAAEKPMLDEIERLFEVYRKTEGEQERAALYHRIDSISYEASKLAIPNEYDKLMAIIGAQGTNAWTSFDETVYQEDIPSNQIDNWARIQADRFRNMVIRGFHTELETIYEEKNMSLTQDNRKMYTAIDEALFPHHPYGRQTVLGTQDNLKNPSITNVKRYKDQYYVPNNIAICVAGDFDPDEMVATIEKYFGDWEPSSSIPPFEFEKEAPITAPIEREVWGLQTEMMCLAWPLPAPRDVKNSAIARIAEGILYNGQAGLLDIDLVQQQKVLAVGAGTNMMSDYGEFLILGYAKEGQNLDDLRAIFLEEIAKLRNGDFDESLVEATVNNIKLSEMRALESNSSRAHKFVDSFIQGVDWKDCASEIKTLGSITKKDVMAWASEFLNENGYVAVYKRQGEDTSIKKLSAPAITPIVTNRDKASTFLTGIQNSTVKPIEPVFIDFDKELSVQNISSGVDLIYKKNETNDIFTLQYEFRKGTADDPALALAFDYLGFLGTADMSAGELASKMYGLACNYSFSYSENTSSIRISGLSENMAEAASLVDKLLSASVPDDAILTNLKSDLLRSRMIAKTDQRMCASAMNSYLMYGPEYIRSNQLDNQALSSLTSEDLISKVKELMKEGHDIYYYGPAQLSSVRTDLAASHTMAPGAVKPEYRFPEPLKVDANSVVMVQYDANQLYHYGYSNNGLTYDPALETDMRLYGEYFGNSMASVVFQELREARGLAYSAQASCIRPDWKGGSYGYITFIATQNDKMKDALDNFDRIVNEMPLSENSFNIAKESLISGLRTRRYVGTSVFSAYDMCRRLGLDEPLDRRIFEEIQDKTIEDVLAFQQKYIKGLKRTYGILGDIPALDTDYLKTLGPVKVVSLEEIFGY